MYIYAIAWHWPVFKNIYGFAYPMLDTYYIFRYNLSGRRCFFFIAANGWCCRMPRGRRSRGQDSTDLGKGNPATQFFWWNVWFDHWYVLDRFGHWCSCHRHGYCDTLILKCLFIDFRFQHSLFDLPKPEAACFDRHVTLGWKRKWSPWHLGDHTGVQKIRPKSLHDLHKNMSFCMSFPKASSRFICRAVRFYNVLKRKKATTPFSMVSGIIETSNMMTSPHTLTWWFECTSFHPKAAFLIKIIYVHYGSWLFALICLLFLLEGEHSITFLSKVFEKLDEESAAQFE